MQFRAGFANPFCERAFNIHVHVFERFVPWKFAGANFFFDLAQAEFDFFLFGSGNDSGLCERDGVRNRAGNVVSIESMIERNRFAVTRGAARERFSEASFAHCN